MTSNRTPQKKVVVTAALTGVLATRKQCPAIPYTPQEIADEAVRSYEAGASIVHIHAREPDGSASWKPEYFAEIAEKTRARCPVLLNYSTGGIDGTIESRTQHLRGLHGAIKPDMAALNMGSMNYAIYSRKQKKFLVKAVFENSFDDIEYLFRLFAEHGISPELECFDAGHICNADPFIDMGLMKRPYHFSLIMGVTGGISATEKTLLSQVDLLPEDAHWQLIGISQAQWPLIEKSLDLGGHIRVGLEDNFYLPNGEMARSNAELVEWAVKKIRERGQEVG